jgi:hypothetical protein
MSFKEIRDAIDAEEKAMALTAERYEKARKEWEETETRYVSLRADLSDDDGDILTRIVGLIRRHGPKAAKYLGYPGVAAVGMAGVMAEEGTFIGPGGIISLIGQLFGW